MSCNELRRETDSLMRPDSTKTKYTDTLKIWIRGPSDYTARVI